MNSNIDILLNCIKEISCQVNGLSEDMVSEDILILGDASLFDSFSILLFLVEIENVLSKDILAGRSLIEWFSTLDFTTTRQMTLKQFSECLFNDFLKV